MVGVTKPDGSVTTTVYDNKQRVTSTVERTATGAVITGFEYTYDDLSRIIEEKVLANSTKMCYTYDNLSRVTARTVKKLSDNSVVSTETFNYDAAGNVTSAPDSSFQYDTNNRLISFNGNTVSYDLDGNMLSNGTLTCTYDSANRLVSAGGHTYTYNAEDVRIRNLCSDEDTTYTYNTNAKLSMLLMKTTGGVVTKYVYGRGLIGEEANNTFKTYHFDCRGSTIAITDSNGNITDTFAYDTYGKCISRTGTSRTIFLYDGIDGVVSDINGLCYMRARYYSPDMRRFVNADVIHGEISEAITLNRYAYAYANPVSFVDPIGLSFLLTLGLIALGAVIGGAVSAISSVIEQKKEGEEVNWKEVAVDAAWGALEGGISASPLGFVGQTIASAAISAGQSITDQYFDSDNKEEFDLSDVDYLEVGASVAIDVGFSMLDIKKPNKAKELNKVVSSLDDKIARETRRANKEVISTFDGKIARKTKRSIEIGKKRIAKASRAKSNAIRGTVTDMLIDPFVDPFTPKQIAQNSVEFVVDKLFFDNDEETYSRK